MKNLTVHRRASRFLDFLNETVLLDSEKSKTLHAVNPNNDDFYLLHRNKLHKIPSKFNDDVTSYDVDENLKLVGLEYCNITQELYGACETGDIVRMNMEFKFECEIVAQLNVHIQCMKLSPDHEMLILVTVDGTVITMVSTLQIISEVNLHSSDFGLKQFVTVGWGKKETQFHGSEGKSAAKAKPVEINKNEADDGMARITWREDGSLFAVGFLNRESNARQFKVFNREGILQYTSELVNGLEESLSWKPSGSLIATTLSLVNKHVVALFEKNGLKHREFTLPFEPKEVIIEDLFWSPDSEILTIWCKTKADSVPILQLWTENNYHWYLKQRIEFSTDDPLIYAMWSVTSRSKKLILLTHKELIHYHYNWTVNHSRGKNANDKAVVGVIDGNKILVTGFKVGIVPPPMAHQSLEASESVNAVAFAPDIEIKGSWIDSNTFFCISSSNKLMFYKHFTNSSLLDYEYIGSYEIEWNIPKPVTENTSCSFQHFLWFDKNTILCSALEANHSFLCVLLLDEVDDEKHSRVVVQNVHIMDGLIEHIVPSPDPGEAYVVVENSVLKYTKEMEVSPTDVVLPEYTYKVEVAKVNDRSVVLSLSHRNSFSIDGKQIANNVTSFYLHSEFLLLTTLQHTLVCATLNEKGFDGLVKQDLTVKPWESNFNDKSSTDMNVRRVERGSFLITAISKDSKTILQMPRGNLECIQPRALSLYIIGYHLNNYDYLSAFDLMRRQRINLNLIYDHDPKKFIDNAEKFVEEISKPNWLSLFLSELQDEDVTATTYANYYWSDRVKSDVLVTSKVEFVCELLHGIMERKNTDRLIQPILISLVKNQRTQGLEAALSKIKEMKNAEECNKQSITPEDALKYLLYLVDVNVLFDTALGMYDFDLTMFIASKSQKDPKEYIPFLNELKKLDVNYMKYSIDMHLKRYESALKHIAKEHARFNECINLVRNHNLYTKALKLFKKGSTEYKEVARAYGEFLFKKNKYQEAGVMFYRSGDLALASNAYKLAGNWQDVIIVATQMQLSPLEKNELYKELVERLKSDKRYRDAATILLNYLNDVEEAVASLCDGKQWKDAIRTASDVQRADLIGTHVKPSVYEYADHIVSQVQKYKYDFEKHKLRLSVVRANLSQRNSLYDSATCDNELAYNRGMSDILSDTSSVAGSTASQKSRSSVTSGRSYRSSKNRRKQERKLLSMKEGSVFEDLGLIQALHHIITNTYKEKDDVSSLIQMLVRFGDDEYAEEVQHNVDTFLRLLEKSKSEIWDKSAPCSLTEMEKLDISTPAQIQELAASQKVVEPYITSPPETNSSPWRLDIF